MLQQIHYIAYIASTHGNELKIAFKCLALEGCWEMLMIHFLTAQSDCPVFWKPKEKCKYCSSSLCQKKNPIVCDVLNIDIFHLGIFIRASPFDWFIELCTKYSECSVSCCNWIIIGKQFSRFVFVKLEWSSTFTRWSREHVLMSILLLQHRWISL